MATANKLNEFYKSAEGDKVALTELRPIVQRYLKTKNPKILEIGCGYGRNFLALASIPGSQITGCDISPQELEKAAEKIKQYKIENAGVVLQTAPNQLPFDNNTFDFIIIWQVLEHISSTGGKQSLLDEAARVCKNHGSILIETPNQLFPIDYHDSNLPFVHWFLPDKWRNKITAKLRHEDFPPSQYLTIFSLRQLFNHSPHVKAVKQRTTIFFEERYIDIFKNLSGTRRAYKIFFFILYFPLYCILRLLHFPGDTLTPSLRVVFEIEK